MAGGENRDMGGVYTLLVFSLVWSGETGVHTQNNTARAVVSGLRVGAGVRHDQIYVYAEHRAGISW